MHVARARDPGAKDLPAIAAPPTSRQTALVIVGQAALMGFGAILALVIAQSFGKSSRTDAFFAAYGLYSVGLVFSGTFRLTAVSPLVRATGPDMATRLLGAVALLVLACALPMVLLASPVGALLAASDPTGVAATSLRILWIALAGQLLGAMLATILTVRGSFTALGLITLLSGLVMCGVFVVARGTLGIDAAAVGIAAGGLWISGVSVAVLYRSGWRPAQIDGSLLRGTMGETRRLAYTSLTFVGISLSYVVSLALVARQGEGEATLYSYAYVLAAILVALTANVSAMIRSPSLVASESRTAETAAVGAWSLRMTIVIGGPALGLAALVGPPMIGVALGSGFTTKDVTSILVALVCFVGWTLASASGIFAIVELLAREDLRRLGLLAAAQVGAVAALGALAGAIAGMPGIAAALSIVAAAVTLTQLHWAFGERIGAAMRRVGADLGREAVVIVLGFGPPTLLLWALDASTVGYAAAGVLAVLLVVPLSVKTWPAEIGALLCVLRRD